MAEKLGLGNEVRELKIGQSFTNPKSTGFHTVKYDFKPASVDTNKKATVDVGGNNQVTVTVPHLDGAGVPQTVFKGSQRPYQKECVLIINRVTGEITLEKLGYNIQVKKTRSEYNKLHLSHDRLSQSQSQGSGSSSDRPSPSPSAAPPPSRSQTPPMVAHRVSNKTRVTSGSRRSAANADHHRPPPPTGALHLVPKHSPLRASPGHPSPGRYGRATGAGTGGSPGRREPQHGSNESHSQSTLASLPMIGIDDYSEPVLPAPTQTTHNYSQHSHHNSRSHHNSASAPSLFPSSLSDSENNGAVGTISDSSSSSSDSDSDSDDGKVAHSNDRNATAYNVNAVKTNGYNNGAVRIDTHLLNDDLCLSESGSDSD